MLKEGEKILVVRDCHYSVINSIVLSRANPVYLLPEINQYGFYNGIDIDNIKKKICEHNDIKAVFITRPSYYGVCAELKDLKEYLGKKNIILIVDEAHGAHLNFCECLPSSANCLGADIVIQSAHKTLPAFNQGAYLHINNERIDIEKIEFYLKVFQTSSPSYIIMMFLDIAKYYEE